MLKLSHIFIDAWCDRITRPEMGQVSLDIAVRATVRVSRPSLLTGSIPTYLPRAVCSPMPLYMSEQLYHSRGSNFRRHCNKLYAWALDRSPARMNAVGPHYQTNSGGAVAALVFSQLYPEYPRCRRCTRRERLGQIQRRQPRVQHLHDGRCTHSVHHGAGCRCHDGS